MKREETIDYLANIYATILADDEVDRLEERCFEEIAREIGAGYFERKRAIEKAGTEELPAQLALRWSDQVRNLEDMIFVGYCDGKLDPSEKKIIVNYANFLGISQTQLASIRDEAKHRFAAFK